MPDRRLVAWIEPRGELHVAAFVGEPVSRLRRPATRECTSYQYAWNWIEGESFAVGLPVEWMNEPPAVGDATCQLNAVDVDVV